MPVSRARARTPNRSISHNPLRRALPADLVFLRGRDADARLRRLMARRAAVRPRLGALALAFVAAKGHERLGFASLGDWSRERIGVGARTVREWARVWRALGALPMLREAVLAGEVSWTVARLVVGLATPETDAACAESVRFRSARAVEAMVAVAKAAEAGGGREPAPDRSSDRTRIHIHTSRVVATKWVAACEIARRAAGENLPSWQCAEAIAAEAVAAFGSPELREPEPKQRPLRFAAEDADPFRARTNAAVPAPPDFVGRRPRELDGRLRAALVELQAVDFEVGVVLKQVAGRGLWRELGFRSFDDYVREGLDLAPRTARRLVRIARAPEAVATAFRAGQITLLKAEVLLRGGDVAVAETTTLRRLEEDVPEFDFSAPREVAALFRAMVARVGLEAMLDEALATWLSMRGRVHPVVRRDGYRCSVPVCTARRNLQVHHVVFRSRGGGDEAENLTTLCAWHHLRGVHEGRIAIDGRAPDGLVYTLGVGRYVS